MTDRCSQASQETYLIRVKGQLDSKWADWFGDMTIAHATSDETVISGPVTDQAALHGMLSKIRDLGMPLLLVERLQ